MTIHTAAVLLTAVGLLTPSVAAPKSGRILDCESAFPPATDRCRVGKDLRPAARGAGEIQTGEGQTFQWLR